MTVDKTTAKKYADMKVTVQAQSKTELSERIKINTIADSMFVIEGASLTERILTHAEYGETLLVSGNLEFTDNKDYEEFSGKPVSFFLNGKRRETFEEAVNAEMQEAEKRRSRYPRAAKAKPCDWKEQSWNEPASSSSSKGKGLKGKGKPGKCTKY